MNVLLSIKSILFLNFKFLSGLTPIFIKKLFRGLKISFLSFFKLIFFNLHKKISLWISQHPKLKRLSDFYYNSGFEQFSQKFFRDMSLKFVKIGLLINFHTFFSGTPFLKNLEKSFKTLSTNRLSFIISTLHTSKNLLLLRKVSEVKNKIRYGVVVPPL